MVKELDCGSGSEGSILFNDIQNLILIDDNINTYVLNDFKMSTYFYLKFNPCEHYT